MTAAPGPFAEPWDGQEPVLSAIRRFGLKELFDLAIANGLREQALALLLEVGVPELKAMMILDGVFSDGARPTAYPAR